MVEAKTVPAKVVPCIFRMPNPENGGGSDCLAPPYDPGEKKYPCVIFDRSNVDCPIARLWDKDQPPPSNST